MKRYCCIAFLLLLAVIPESYSQKNPLFDQPEMLEMVERSGDFMYHGYFDSVLLVLDTVALLLPGHPVIPMVKAMNEAWKDQPIHTTSPYFSVHYRYLQEVIARCDSINEDDPENIEALFFEMSARGLLAEYYADEGSNFKALDQARVTYDLIIESMKLTHRSPEFYFLAGLYNYFREKYPERHPIYKSFVWIFKSGNMPLGLAQLDDAVHKSKIVKIEAALYLAYIWLRYEHNPLRAKTYLLQLHEQYPTNDYFRAKLVECLVALQDYQSAIPLIVLLQHSKNKYYQMCGTIYQGHCIIHTQGDRRKAIHYLQKGLAMGDTFPERGIYYKSVAYMDLGMDAAHRGAKHLAKAYYEQVISWDTDDALIEEAERRLGQL